jgi:SNF2 family DNA or RNA helicase
MSLVSRRRLWSFFEALYSQELNESSAKSATPVWLKTQLLPHQQSAVAAALNLEKAKLEGMDVGTIAGDALGGKFYTTHGILGDRVGSGKSLTALALIKAPPPPAQYIEYVVRNGATNGDGRDVGLLRARNQIKTSLGTQLKQVSTTLFIIPHSLMSQWETYVTRDTTLKAQFIKRKLDAVDETFMANIEKYDVIFVSATMYSTWRNTHPIRTILWNRLFIDEADSIAISTDHDELHALFYWFITASWLNLVFSGGAFFNISQSYPPIPTTHDNPGTPQHIIDRVMKLQGGNSYLTIPGVRHVNIVRRVCGMSVYASSVALNAAGSQSARLIVHSTEDYIQNSFAMPTVTHKTLLCATPPNIRVLDTFISPDMMERLNAGDVAGALTMIGMSTHTESEIADAVTASLTHELDQAKKLYEFKKVIDYSSESAKLKALEVCEQKIASIESRIIAIQDRIKRSKEQTCPICYCDVTSPSVTPCCKQLFCFPCLCESLKRVAACPLCRERITDLKTIQVVGNTIVNESQLVQQADPNKKLSKNETFIKFLLEHPNAKILMFSGYDATFSGMEVKLQESNIKYATVNGSQARINKLLREFQNGKYNVLFLNARNMGAGLNIECATHVVMFHRMSSELENQIIGRAMRLGRKQPLDVVHMLHENELGNTISHA